MHKLHVEVSHALIMALVWYGPPYWMYMWVAMVSQTLTIIAARRSEQPNEKKFSLVSRGRRAGLGCVYPVCASYLAPIRPPCHPG